MNKRERRADAEWQQLIEQQRRGLSARTFCQHQCLESKTFYKRRQALRQAATATDSTERFRKLSQHRRR